MRVRIFFSKTETMRYTSHLDLYRAWERLLRRANLPLSYTQGIKPHPRINLASALPLGFTSIGELVDIHLNDNFPIEYIFSTLQKTSPPGIVINSIVEIDSKDPKLQSQLEASVYLVTFKYFVPDLEEKIQMLLNANSTPRIRRGKSYDLKTLILCLKTLPFNEHGQQQIKMTLKTKEAATGRPEEVVDELGVIVENCLFERVSLILDINTEYETEPDDDDLQGLTCQ